MNVHYRLLGSIVVICSILLAGCNFPGRSGETLPEGVYTQAAHTVAAQLTGTPEQPKSTPEKSPAGTKIPEAGLNTPTPASTASLPPVTKPPVLTATPTETLILLFSDDFSKEGGWYTEQGEKYGFEYLADGYRIYVNIPNAEIWSIRDKEYRDVILEVDAARMAGAKDGYYGLICRQVDDENYYALVISSNGFFGIGKMEAGEMTFLQEGTDTSGMINPNAAAFNKIRADCSGDMLRLYVNGKLLGQTQDPGFIEGNTGLIIGTRAQPDLEVLFDNFATYQRQP